MVTRIGGLASGMDIDSLVKQLMTAERAPLDKLRQRKQTLEWQRDDYRSINTLLLNFRDELTQMKLTSKYRARTTSSTNDTYVSATANGSATQSSVSISKVTQLAGTERILNGEKLTYNASQSLYEQTKTNPDITWKHGSVESKTLTGDGTKNQFTLDVPVGNLKDFESWSVKVNGKGYKVVTDRAQLTENNVYVDSTSGSIEFLNAPAKDSSIRVDYVTLQRTDTLKLSNSTTSLQLARGSVNEVSGQQIKLTRKVTTGETSVTEPEKYFSIDAGKIYDGSTEIGSLDYATGKITFTEAGAQHLKDQGYLPPEKPENGEVYDYNMEISYNQNYTTFSVDTVTSKGNMHETFLVQGNETISMLSSKVSSSNVGATLFYDSVSGQMSLSRKETGEFNTSADYLNGNDIAVSGSLMENIFEFSTGTVTSGVNAKFEINGIETERTSNTFTMDGVTFTLKQTFGEGTANPTATPVTLNINNDGNQVFDNIVQFVNKYNELIEKIQSKSSEERYRSYTPLTDEQRESMSEKQQELWDEKAKSGLLRRDPILTSVLSDMRMDFYQPVANENVSNLYNQLSELGITTGANFLEGGKLTINETKLKESIEKDPQSVENFFRGDGTTEGQKGVINRLYDTVTASMDQLRSKAGNSYTTNQSFAIGKQLDSLDDSIYRFEDRLVQVENRYWAQFTAMEKAVQRANEQSAYLMQMFGG